MTIKEKLKLYKELAARNAARVKMWKEGRV